ncbi:MAG: hypothetical protein JNK85_24910 [Verrucomicrobiales bacterium]|nr:hypothetical protein [Verrucomicrobiales bacterium]
MKTCPRSLVQTALLVFALPWYPAVAAHTLELAQATYRVSDPPTLHAGEPSTAEEGKDRHLRFQIVRNGDRSQPCSVEYRTLADGTASPGVDFVPQTGVLHFAANEQYKEAAVPVLDDGVVEGLPETVRFELFNPSQGVAIGQRVGESFIRDDEVPTTLDVNFRPEVGAASILAVQPDGKILVRGWSPDAFRIGSRWSAMARLHADGSVDREFFVDVDLSEGLANPALVPGGGMIISGVFKLVNGVPRRGLARLRSNGQLDTTFVPADEATAGFLEHGSWPGVVVLRSGRVVLWNPWDSSVGPVALHPDGSIDTEFIRNAMKAFGSRGSLVSIKEHHDGRLLCILQSGFGETVTQSLIALREDGTSDPDFVESSAAFIVGVFPLADGRIAVSYERRGLALEAGLTDRATLSYLTAQGRVKKTVSLPDGYSGVPLLEQDGKVYWAGVRFQGGYRAWIQRMDAEGRWDPDFISPMLVPVDTLSYLNVFASLHQGGLLCWTAPRLSHPLDHSFWESPGLVRILTRDIPASSFAWSPNSVAREGAPVAEVRVHRLGDLSRPAAVNFATRDGRARAGFNYVATQGVLRFEPLESRKTIQVPLINITKFEGAPDFVIELSQPSDPSAVLARPLSVRIYDDEPGILPETFWRRPDGAVQFKMTVASGVSHVIENSSDLRSWRLVDAFAAESPLAMEFEDWPDLMGPWFYRVRRR